MDWWWRDEDVERINSQGEEEQPGFGEEEDEGSNDSSFASSDEEEEEEEEDLTDQGLLARGIQMMQAWIARVHERESERHRLPAAEASAVVRHQQPTLPEAAAEDGEANKDDSSSAAAAPCREMQWFHYNLLRGGPAARRGHSATLVPYDFFFALSPSSSASTTFTSTTSTCTTSSAAAAPLLPSRDHMSLMELQIRDEEAARQARELDATERCHKRRRLAEAEAEVEGVARQARCGDRFLVFGGNCRQRFMNDLYVLNIELKGKPVLRWDSLVHRIDTSGQPPEPRSHHTATLVGQTLWIFGGSNFTLDRASFDAMWALDLWSGEWRCPELVHPLRPAARYGHSAVAFGDKVVIYGGTSDDATQIMFDDVWEFDTVRLSWRRIDARLDPRSAAASQANANANADLAADRSQMLTLETDLAVRPAGRHFHTATYLGHGQMLVYGGRNAEHVFHDVLLLDLLAERWHVVPVTDAEGPAGEAPVPRGRAGHTASLMSAALTTATAAPRLVARVLVYGGWDGAKDITGEEVGALGDAAVLTVEVIPDEPRHAARWAQCPVVGSPPVERDCHTAVVVETRRAQPRLFIFGGTDGAFKPLSNLCALDFARRLGAMGGVPSLFKLALHYVSSQSSVWPPAAPERRVELSDFCTESVTRELLFYASNGGYLISP